MGEQVWAAQWMKLDVRYFRGTAEEVPNEIRLTGVVSKGRAMKIRAREDVTLRKERMEHPEQERQDNLALDIAEGISMPGGEDDEDQDDDEMAEVRVTGEEDDWDEWEGMKMAIKDLEEEERREEEKRRMREKEGQRRRALRLEEERKKALEKAKLEEEYRRRAGPDVGRRRWDEGRVPPPIHAKVCDICDMGIPERTFYYNCAICQDGDFDICGSCYHRGSTCEGAGFHGLRRIRYSY